MANVIKRVCIAGYHFMFHCHPFSLVLFEQLVAAIRLQNRNIILGFYYLRIWSTCYHIAYSKFSGNQSSIGQSGEELADGVIEWEQ